MPCPAGVSIPEVFALFNNCSMYGRLNEYTSRYNKLGESKNDASFCKTCGLCQKACPQSLPIMENLKEPHKYFSSEK